MVHTRYVNMRLKSPTIFQCNEGIEKETYLPSPCEEKRLANGDVGKNCRFLTRFGQCLGQTERNSAK